MINTRAYNFGLDLLSILLARAYDFSWVVFSAVLVYYLRFYEFYFSIEYQVVILIGALSLALVSSSMGVYSSWRGRSKLSLIGRVVAAWLVAFSFLFALLIFSHQAIKFSRIWLGGWFLLGVSGSVIFRVATYKILGRLRTKGINHKKVLVVGAGGSANTVLSTLQNNSWVGFDVVQIVPIGKEVTLDSSQGIEVGGDLETLAETVSKKYIQEVWVCLPLSEGGMVDKVLYALRHSTANIRYVPDLSDFRLLNHRVSEIAGVHVMDLSCSPLSGGKHYIKALEDRILGLCIFVLISPILALISIGVKLSSPGPVIYKQYRHGIDGKPINIYKFRSMKIHKENEGQVTQATKNDSRVTRFGAFLRKTSLDELPQFFNVIQGKMSIVGPRPHALAHNEHYKEIVESYMKRHKVKPGITGWAQVNGLRGETDTIEKMKKRVEYDLLYIENWSLMLDLKIIFLTLLRGFINKNAY